MLIRKQIAVIKPSEIDEQIRTQITRFSLQDSKLNHVEPRVPFEYFLEHIENSNTLNHLIESMVVNCDGTGFDIQLKEINEETEEEDERAKELLKVFMEPWPGESFLSQRKRLRRDLEGIGNAYIEVIRNAAGDIAFWRRLNPIFIRQLVLDDAVTVQKTVSRFGQDVTFDLPVREKRYVQMLGKDRGHVMFKEFNASRDLDRETGEWAEAGSLPFEQRASEIIHLTLIDDPLSPYGQPRWYNQARSIIGSREAEDLNVEYFRNGGIPPVIFMVSGGKLAIESQKMLQQGLNSPGNRLSAAVIYADPTGGMIDKTNAVKIDVERFGSEQQDDALFMEYDKACEEKVRTSFRLPPIFVGKADDYTRATAVASALVAEAQVFKPEREEFDQIITRTILAEFDDDYEFLSNPVAMSDDELKLNALTLAGDANVLSAETLVEAINLLTGLNLQVAEGADGTVDTGADESDDLQDAEAGNLDAEADAQAVEVIRNVLDSPRIVARKYVEAGGLNHDDERDPELLAACLVIKSLYNAQQLAEFDQACADYYMEHGLDDPGAIITALRRNAG